MAKDFVKTRRVKHIARPGDKVAPDGTVKKAETPKKEVKKTSKE